MEAPAVVSIVLFWFRVHLLPTFLLLLLAFLPAFSFFFFQLKWLSPHAHGGAQHQQNNHCQIKLLLVIGHSGPCSSLHHLLCIPSCSKPESELHSALAVCCSHCALNDTLFELGSSTIDLQNMPLVRLLQLPPSLRLFRPTSLLPG